MNPTTLRALKIAYRLLGTPSLDDIPHVIRTLQGEAGTGDTALVDLGPEIREMWVSKLLLFGSQNPAQRNETAANIRIAIQAHIHAFENRVRR